jgi:hypothetical protein
MCTIIPRRKSESSQLCADSEPNFLFDLRGSQSSMAQVTVPDRPNGSDMRKRSTLAAVSFGHPGQNQRQARSEGVAAILALGEIAFETRATLLGFRW